MIDLRFISKAKRPKYLITDQICCDIGTDSSEIMYF